MLFILIDSRSSTNVYKVYIHSFDHKQSRRYNTFTSYIYIYIRSSNSKSISIYIAEDKLQYRVLIIGAGCILKFISVVDEGIKLVVADESIFICISSFQSFPSSVTRDHRSQLPERFLYLFLGQQSIAIAITIQKQLPQLLLAPGLGLNWT